MRIEVKGRNMPISDDLREYVIRRFRVIDRQVSDLAQLEIEVFHESNPSIPDSQVVRATLQLKGVTLRASKSDRDLMHCLNMVSDELTVQVKRHRDKRRKRRETRAAVADISAHGRPLQAT